MKNQRSVTASTAEGRGQELAKKPQKRLTSLQRYVKTLGIGPFSTRNATGRALWAWRNDLIADLGGEAEISTQQMTLIEMATRSKLVLDSIDAFCMKQTTLVVARRRSAHPIVAQRNACAESLMRILLQLGLKRVTKRVPTLEAYLASQGKEIEKVKRVNNEEDDHRSDE